MEKTAPSIQMVDLKSQYQKLKAEVDEAVIEVIESCAFINGPKVREFQATLETYLGVNTVIPCANGTDALQIALMALDLKPGDEVIVPAFTYISTAEVIALLGLSPVMVDVDPDTFNVTADIIESALSEKTKLIVPVNLFGQSADIEPIMQLANKHGIPVVEDNAQAIGADYTLKDGSVQKTGTLSTIGTTSFYPSKNLGAYGDAGALYTNDEALGQKLRMIANHGQNKRYYHAMVGVNSRLDSIQAAILNIKLKYLDDYAAARQKVAAAYDTAFSSIEQLQIPIRQENSTHVFHQYTLKVKDGRRDELKAYLQERGVPSMIYYPVPLYEQEAFKNASKTPTSFLPNTDMLCKSVLSLPIHTEMNTTALTYIIESITKFFE